MVLVRFIYDVHPLRTWLSGACQTASPGGCQDAPFPDGSCHPFDHVRKAYNRSGKESEEGDEQCIDVFFGFSVQTNVQAVTWWGIKGLLQLW